MNWGMMEKRPFNSPFPIYQILDHYNTFKIKQYQDINTTLNLKTLKIQFLFGVNHGRIIFLKLHYQTVPKLAIKHHREVKVSLKVQQSWTSMDQSLYVLLFSSSLRLDYQFHSEHKSFQEPITSLNLPNLKMMFLYGIMQQATSLKLQHLMAKSSCFYVNDY